jgi:glycosyltransferase involved in cell wall biosynthesis
VLLRGLPIPRYPDLRMGLPAKSSLIKLWALQRPDVVHIVTEGPLGWSALQAAKRLKLPVTSDFRTNFHAYSRHYGIGWLKRPIFAYLRKFHNRTDCTMVPTEALKRDLEASGFHNVAVVARGVDTKLFTPARRDHELRRTWGADPDTTVVVSVGRLAPEKNLSAIIAAYRAMREADPTIKLVMVGDGPAREDMRQRCPDAIFAGQRTGHDLAAHYASGDIFLFPSLTETFGNVTPEAMASGLPVVAYDYAAAAKLIRSGENGLTAALDNSAEFTTHALRLASDRAAAKAMGQAARATACEHDWERIVGHLEAILQTAGRAPTRRALALEVPGKASVPAAH